jgi:hypothetical protein
MEEETSSAGKPNPLEGIEERTQLWLLAWSKLTEDDTLIYRKKIQPALSTPQLSSPHTEQQALQQPLPVSPKDKEASQQPLPSSPTPKVKEDP